ncbi:MAG: UDP-N-acetylmuramate dehydrogenase [Candidatus Zixiibacteriota bacterium]
MATTTVSLNRSNRRPEVYEELSGVLGGQVRRNVILAPYTTFGIGGKADLFYPVTRPEDLVYAVRTAQKLRVRVLVLGGGSNVLISDSGFRGLVILNRCADMHVSQDAISCQSGAWLSDVVHQAGDSALAGLEFAAGIPGTVGGAIRGNAGAFGQAVGDLLVKAIILTANGEIQEVKKDYFQFAYRESTLRQNGDILLSAKLRLQKGHPEEIKEKIEVILKKREASLPWKEMSAGCFFKNVLEGGRRVSTGLLLDRIGAKRMRIGDAQVSTKHANIIINAGKARALDVKKLARQLKIKAREKLGIYLDEEVVYINGGFSRK